MHNRSQSAFGAAVILCLAAACASPKKSWEEGAKIAVTPQRPSYSSNTYTTAPGTLEVEAGVLIDPSDALDTGFVMKYGYDDRSEILVGVLPGVAVEGAGVGFGDLRLGWRQRLTEHQLGKLSLAYQALVKLPTADENKGLGTGEVDGFIAGIGTLPMEGWSATGYVELGLLGDPVNSGTDLQLALAGAMDRAMAGATSVFGEVAGIFIDDQDHNSIFTTLGANWSPTPGLVLDTAVLVGLSNDAPDFQFLVGFTRNLGRASGYAPRRNW
jgi:hypothetical protein